MADVEVEAVPEKKKSDLGVRAASAVVMLVVAGTALWFGGRVFDAFVGIVGAVCFGEFARLIWLATPSLPLRLAGWLFGAIYIGLATFFLINMEAISVLVCVLLVIATDVCAYFAGRRFGNKKIAPSISPSKTWAGLYGGMAGASLLGMVYLLAIAVLMEGMRHSGAAWSGIHLGFFLPAIAIGCLTAVLAQAGDFFESWLKRKAGVKDSSSLIPGHGGVFDRIDGLLPVTILAGTFWWATQSIWMAI